MVVNLIYRQQSIGSHGLYRFIVSKFAGGSFFEPD